jgi:hypothetical protein
MSQFGLRVLSAAAGLLLIPGTAFAQYIQVRGALALHANIKCFTTHVGWITTSTGPCSNFNPPQEIILGATFQANGESWKINYIEALQADGDMPDLGIKAGEWSCAAVESLADLPTGDPHDSTWLTITPCEPKY